MATPSAMNRSYGMGGGLANRPGSPVGSGGMTPQRRMEQMQRRAITQGDNRTVGDIARFQSFQNIQQNWQQRPRMQPPTGMQRMPMMPPLPRDAGPGDMMPPSPSAPDAPAPMPMPMDGGQTPPPPMQMPVDIQNMLPPLPMATRPGVPQVPAGFENMMPALPSFNPQAPLPPSTFMGGAGVPPPPQFQAQQVGGSEILTQNTPDGPKFLGQRGLPTLPAPTATTEGLRMLADYNEQNPQRPLEMQGFDTQGNYILAPKTLPQPTEKVTLYDDGTVTRSYTQPRGQTPAPAANPGAAGAGANGGAAYTTPGGVQVQLVPDQASAGTQMGQMPNEAYANPLTPEQSLAAARDEYAKTGKDDALRRHFQQFPSASTRLANEEAKIWQQVGEQLNAFGNAVDDRGAARQRRDVYLNQAAPMTQGFQNNMWQSVVPKDYAKIDQQLPTLDRSLIEQANNLNKISQTRRAMNLR